MTKNKKCPGFYMAGGVPRHASWRVRATPPWIMAGYTPATLARWSATPATSDLYPATMHGGVQCICPAMHGGGAKRVRFKIFLKDGLNLKFVSNLG
jgi:hypothetical protein